MVCVAPRLPMDNASFMVSMAGAELCLDSVILAGALGTRNAEEADVWHGGVGCRGLQWLY